MNLTLKYITIDDIPRDYGGQLLCWNCEIEGDLNDMPEYEPHFCRCLCQREWEAAAPLKNLLWKRNHRLRTNTGEAKWR
jgi:hypothetical protein